MTPPVELIELVARFERNIDAYKTGQYNEAQVRQEYIDPFFDLLGWDMRNRQGYAEAYKDVIHEDSLKIGGTTRAPDYCFRIGGTRKFFLEAKKPSIDIRGGIGPAYQVRRYAWSAALPLSILTDFEEFAVYDCRVKPDKNDEASRARTMYFTCEQYPEKWDEISSIFSRDAVLKGSFDKYAEKSGRRRGTMEVDKAFLEEIESWRDTLARNIAIRNPDLNKRELNFAVQKTIDRIIFLRICEDRGIEKYLQLMSLQNGPNTYKRLLELFRNADQRYNSGLFHFNREKERPDEPDTLTPKLIIDDNVLKKIIKNLYYPNSPYEFSVLPADILGQVYEQFLGKVIRLTKGHQARVEDKPEVKKAGGVYYTPTYIVDYIVKNTVGKLLDGKTPKQAEKLCILDPACGSGSFLIGAYQNLLEWHREYYEQNEPAKLARKRRPPIYQGSRGEWRLTTSEKKRILLNNIYGVDIDLQAVEVTKLSLLLKVLENEDRDTLQSQLTLFRERALPDLGDNIKCGNSLIGPDFYNEQQMSLIDDEERFRINIFDWNTQFAEIMESGGFDTVIGNPPWGASFSDSELDYFRSHYSRVIARMIDSYIYFIDRSIQLTKLNGLVGFIIPSTILNQIDAQPVRELLLNRGLSVLLNLGQGIFGTKVLNTSTIFVSGKSKKSSLIKIDNLSALPLSERKEALNNRKSTPRQAWIKLVEEDPQKTFYTGRIDEVALLERLRKKHSSLNKYILGGIHRGVSPDIAAANVVSTSEAKSLKLENKILRPCVSGQQIKRYRDWNIDKYIIYTTKNIKIEKYPNTLKHLKPFKDRISCREVIEGKHPWWALHRPRDPDIFTSPKFIGLTTTKTIELIYDRDASVYVTDAMYVFQTIPNVDPWAFMAIMQSKLFLFLYKVSNQGESRVIPQVKASKIGPLPFPNCKSRTQLLTKLSDNSKQMYKLNRKIEVTRIPPERDSLQRQLDIINCQIDNLAYELYGLTDKEIIIVEDEE